MAPTDMFDVPTLTAQNESSESICEVPTTPEGHLRFIRYYLSDQESGDLDEEVSITLDDPNDMLARMEAYEEIMGPMEEALREPELKRSLSPVLTEPPALFPRTPETPAEIAEPGAPLIPLPSQTPTMLSMSFATPLHTPVLAEPSVDEESSSTESSTGEEDCEEEDSGKDSESAGSPGQFVEWTGSPVHFIEIPQGWTRQEVTTLVDHMATSEDPFLRWYAYKSLSEIFRNMPEVLGAVRIIRQDVKARGPYELANGVIDARGPGGVQRSILEEAWNVIWHVVE